VSDIMAEFAKTRNSIQQQHHHRPNYYYAQNPTTFTSAGVLCSACLFHHFSLGSITPRAR
jgi:hypothetical protein